MGETEISASRWKIGLYLCGSLMFVVLALVLLQHPDDEAWKAQLCLAFFGVGSVAFGWLLVHPQRLLLDRHGFTLVGGFTRSPKKVLWRDVDGFFVYRLPRGGKMIGYNLKPEVRKTTIMARFARAITADGSLPKGWPKSPEKMVDDLNAYRLDADRLDAGRVGPGSLGADRFGATSARTFGSRAPEQRRTPTVT